MSRPLPCSRAPGSSEATSAGTVAGEGDSGSAAMLGWVRSNPTESPLSRHDRVLLFWESFLGNFLFSVCMLFGVALTSALAAGVIMAALPGVVALLSWLFLRERFLSLLQRLGGERDLALALSVIAIIGILAALLLPVAAMLVRQRRTPRHVSVST